MTADRVNAQQSPGVARRVIRAGYDFYNMPLHVRQLIVDALQIGRTRQLTAGEPEIARIK